MRRTIWNVIVDMLARILGDKPVRLTPDYALLPEILVVGCGHAGPHLLKQVRGHDHLSIYWPGRGYEYIAGRPVARVTILSQDAGRRLSAEERTMLRQRMATFGPRALWLED